MAEKVDEEKVEAMKEKEGRGRGRGAAGRSWQPEGWAESTGSRSLSGGSDWLLKPQITSNIQRDVGGGVPVMVQPPMRRQRSRRASTSSRGAWPHPGRHGDVSSRP